MRIANWIACAALLLGACSQASARKPRSLLIVTLDTTRADALGCYSGRSGLTPVLDALARESLVYDWARTTAPLTLPAHTSLMTGLYPPRSTVHVNSMQAAPHSAEMLAECFAKAGFDTAAFIGAVVLDEPFGMAQGFAHFDRVEAPRLQTSAHYDSRRAEDVVHAAQGWLDSRAQQKPFFAWLHLFDAHHPYEPPAEFLQQAGGQSYLGEVAYADHWLGELFADLKRRGLWDDLMVVVTADHGESLGEHGEDTHGAFIYDSTMHVPLLVRYPDGYRAGQRDASIVSLVDLYPTALEAFDLPLPAPVDGYSLYRSEPPAAGRYFESMYGYHGFGWSQLMGWVDERGKYLYSARPEFYDPRADRAEARDLIEQHSAEAAQGREQIARVFHAPRLPRGEDDTVQGSVLGALSKLGYANGTSLGLVAGADIDPLEVGDRPAPKDCTESNQKFLRAQALMAQKSFPKAAELLLEVVRKEPKNPNALELFAWTLLQLGQPEQAEGYSRRALACGHEWFGVHHSLALALDRQGKTGEAALHYRKAVELEPDLADVWKRLAELSEQQAAAAEQAGDAASAERCRAEAQRCRREAEQRAATPAPPTTRPVAPG